ncbi:MAG: secondary thiamine-phosphate synthase enzyme YjbQ [Desulfocapsa sp.]|nr:secondary thiamine-phosphate synthase enzyme YjbQ [Desulfocapsa sp.]
MQKLSINTQSTSQMIDITRLVQDEVTKSNIDNGICTVFVPHTTAGITINENADPNVVHDILKQMDKIVLTKDNYRHFEGNSAAHIKASMFGFSVSIIVENNRLVLGTWQGIYFCEFDGPRTRKALVDIRK